MKKFYPSFILILLLLTTSTIKSQRLVEIIEQTEKAALSVSSINSSGSLLAEGSGFFISSDGIAIIPAHLIYLSDSILIKTHNGRKLGIERILQVHPQANLAIAKTNASKSREFTYLIPSKQKLRENQEVLIFGHPNDMEDGLMIQAVKSIAYQVYLSRMVVLNGKLSIKSFGAPLINNKGELAGIANTYSTETDPIALTSSIINDSNWIDINLPINSLRNYPLKNIKFNIGFNEGLYNLTINNPQKAARAFTNYIKIGNKEANIYALRGHARYKYQNTYGCKEDMRISLELDQSCWLVFYYEGLHKLNNNNKKEALVNFSICLDKNPSVSYALVERGRLEIELNKNLEIALRDFVKATQSDSTYGAAFYEKARFTLQYFNDPESASNDVNKAIELDPGLPGVYSIRGMIRIGDENYLAAIDDLTKAINKDPNDTHALFNRGLAEYNLGMKEKACNDWEKAGNLGHYKSIKYSSRYCSGTNRKY